MMKEKMVPIKKVLFKECAVAGTQFHLEYDDELWEELHEGDEVVLVREKRNKYDKNAVAVALESDYDGDPEDFDFSFILGYVPREENEEIAKMLDMGWEDAFYTTLSTVRHEGKLSERLRISIYLKENDKKEKRPYLLRVASLDTEEYRDMLKELIEHGTVHFRWNAIPLPGSNEVTPRVDEEVVFVYRNEKEHTKHLYLMRIIARGEDCMPFVDSEDDIHAVDDCDCFVLTMVVCNAVYYGEDPRINCLLYGLSGPRSVLYYLTEEESVELRNRLLSDLTRDLPEEE